jgi:ATP-dependent Clp protease protease subunit
MPDLAGQKIAYFGFTGPITSEGVGRIAAAFNTAVNSAYDEVYLCFSSIGGLVGDGVYLYNHIRGLPIKCTCHNLGGVYSIAAAVFVAAEQRYCSNHSIFMIHPTTLGPFQEALTWARLDSAMQAALADDHRTEEILRERTTLPDDILSARRVREVFITPAQALEFGLVHEIREFALPKGNEVIQI